MALIPCTCKVKYNATLLNIDIMLLIALGIIGFGIFDIYYATAIAEYNPCTLTNIKGMLIAAGCIYIFIGTCTIVECVYMHIESVAHFNDSEHDRNYYKINGIIIPGVWMLFLVPALIDFAIMVTGLIFNAAEKSCHDTSYVLLIINLYVVGLLPLTLIVATIAIVIGPAIIYGFYYIIKCVTIYIINNAANICCFEINVTNQPVLPTHVPNFESKC